MEIRVLRYFLTVVRENGINRAAEVLHITQPTLSRQLAQLEAELGVSLVNSFNTVFLNLFTALAAGGAVVISQYIGHGENGRSGAAATQLLTVSALFSALVSAFVLFTNASLLRLLFGRVEADVMSACVTYLRISAYSYPALAVYNAGAALYRSFGKTKITMYLSVIANILNLVGNFIGVFVLCAGVAGVAWPSLIARTFSAVAITALCFSQKNPVQYLKNWLFKLDATCKGAFYASPCQTGWRAASSSL